MPPPDVRPLLHDYLAHRRVIGYLGMALPPVLILGGLLLFREGWQGSLSSYYYTGMRNVFVGVLFVLGFYFFSYQGYDEADRRAGLVAFLGALGVALFPGGSSTAWVPIVHYISALSLFGALIFFTRQFRKTKDDEPAKGRKVHRNRIYAACGWTMTIAILGMALYSAGAKLGLYPEPVARFLADLRPIFIGETVAIEAFGISWGVKGQALGILADPDDEE